MSEFRKKSKKYFILFVFLAPLVMCVATSIYVKSFIDNTFVSHPVIIEQNLEKMIDYDMELLTTKEKCTLEQNLINTVTTIDEQEGIVAILLKQKQDGTYNYIYKNDTTKHPEFIDIDHKEYFFKPELIKHSTDTYKIGKYSLDLEQDHSDEIYNFYYLTYKNYIMLWCVRPDLIKTYFINTNNAFITIVLVLFLNAIASFISLISYYCLENRVNYILGKRVKHGKK